VIAIVAAYAVALQMLMGAVIGAQAGAALPSDAFVICFGNGGAQDAPGQHNNPTLDHDLCARLCAQAMTAAADVPPATPVVSLLLLGEQIAVSPRPVPLRLAPQPSPRRAQGPPQIA
jgi:hypothetical protein